MEKTEDFNVLELQELVIKHNFGKKHTSLAQKSMIVKSYLLNHVPLEQLSKDFGVSVRSIRRWISTFAPQTLNMIERLSAESVQQKQGFRENHSTFSREAQFAQCVIKVIRSRVSLRFLSWEGDFWLIININ